MSADATIEALEVMEKGFTVTKRVSRKGGEHIQVNLEITSTHDKQSTTDIRETVPPGTDQSQIGFLPDNEADEWTVTEDGELIFTANLVAGGTRKIIYGIRDIDDDEIEILATEPRLTDISGPAAEIIEEEFDDENETVAPDSEAVAEGSPPAEAEAATGTDGGQATTEASAGEAGTGELPLDDERAAELADQLAPHLSESAMDAVTETKLSQLQDDVADIRAYLPAFEEFLGETGRADDILGQLEELHEKVDDVEGTPEGLEETIEEMETQLADVSEQMASLAETAEEQGTLLEDVTDRLDELEGWREDIASASQ